MFSTPRRRATWLVACAVVGIAGSAAVASDRRYAASLAAVQQTMAVQDAIDTTLSLLKDAETGQRGFLLTGNEDFLRPYVGALRDLDSELRHLRHLTLSDPVQARSAAEVETLATAKLTELKYTIDLRRDRREQEAIARVRE